MKPDALVVSTQGTCNLSMHAFPKVYGPRAPQLQALATLRTLVSTQLKAPEDLVEECATAAAAQGLITTKTAWTAGSSGWNDAWSAICKVPAQAASYLGIITMILYKVHRQLNSTCGLDLYVYPCVCMSFQVCLCMQAFAYVGVGLGLGLGVCACLHAFLYACCM